MEKIRGKQKEKRGFKFCTCVCTIKRLAASTHTLSVSRTLTPAHNRSRCSLSHSHGLPLSLRCADLLSPPPTHTTSKRAEARTIKFILGGDTIVSGQTKSTKQSFLSFSFELFQYLHHERNCSPPGWPMRQPDWS